jgi:hypothetical protein
LERNLVDWKGNSPTGTKYAAADAVYLGSRDKVYEIILGYNTDS